MKPLAGVIPRIAPLQYKMGATRACSRVSTGD
jgi:hypothetical protein